jgi:serine/threonine protein kinase
MAICPYCSSSIPENLKNCPVCGGSLDIACPTCEPLAEGTVIGGKYKIDKVLGSGGFGITYLAYDEKLDRKVAVKEYFPDGIATRTGNKVTMPPTLDNNENLLSFKNEARSIAKLKNIGIVSVYDVIEENDTVYIVMEYIEGTPFSSLLGNIDEKNAVKYMRQIAKAIGSVHAAGLLHQDIKPENIILAKDGSVKIIDFGSSRVFAADKTKTYEKILTPGYAPLEQYGGRGKRGEYTDVYAICATLYALLKGFPPPEATELAGGIEIDLTNISEKLKNILKRGLSIKIPERIQNTASLINLFDELENQEKKYIGIDDSKITGQFNQNNYSIQELNQSQNSVRQNKNLILIIAVTIGIVGMMSLAAAAYFYYPSLTRIFKRFNGMSIKIKSKSKKEKIKKSESNKNTEAKSSETKKSINAGSLQKAYTSPYRSLPNPPRSYYTSPSPKRQVVQAPSIFQNKPNVFSGSGYRDFSVSGCFYCHSIYGKGSKNGSNLSHIGSRLSLFQIENQIRHPNSSMPPNPNMPAQEIEQISGWLESLK